LVPDSKRKGILYFEDLGTKYAGIKSGRNTYTSVLRVICWLNTTFIEKSSCHEITAPVMNEIIKRFCSNPYFSQDGFTKIFVSVSGFPKNGKEIFAAYTYDEAITQYLLPPYESFAIDFNISFAVADNCISEIKLKPDNVC
jgi:hypothetical protein